MKQDTAMLFNPPTQHIFLVKIRQALPFLLLGAVLIWLFGFYFETVASLEASWSRSETFQHGYLIFPLSIWLIWRRSQLLTQIPPTPVFWPLILLAALGAVWVLADLAQVVVIRQYALVLMISLVVAALMGVRFAWALAFPLAFLIFAVPFGDFLIPPMMDFTADFTVNALRLTGIPVYREGNHFSLPSGNWSVVEACSGLRYLISTLTLGCLYAYLTYRRLTYRLIFIGLSIVVPILANGVRAYMIVMLGHLSGMQLAVGVDHLIYGWVFFGIVIMLLFWAGSFWREDVDVKVSEAVNAPTDTPFLPHPKLLLVALVSAAVIAIWPTYTAKLQPALKLPSINLSLPEINGWKKTDQLISSWHPHYVVPRASVHQIYEKDGRTVGIFIGYYNNQTESVKLISSLNALTVTEDKIWTTVGNKAMTLSDGGKSFNVNQSLLRGPDTQLLVWDWFWVKNQYTNSPYMAKWIQAKSRLQQQGDDAAIIILYTRNEERSEATEAALREFANTALPAIAQTLNAAQQN